MRTAATQQGAREGCVVPAAVVQEVGRCGTSARPWTTARSPAALPSACTGTTVRPSPRTTRSRAGSSLPASRRMTSAVQEATRSEQRRRRQRGRAAGRRARSARRRPALAAHGWPWTGWSPTACRAHGYRGARRPERGPRRGPGARAPRRSPGIGSCRDTLGLSSTALWQKETLDAPLDPRPGPGGGAAARGVRQQADPAPPAAGPSAEKSLILATTTSTQDSGLLDELLPAVHPGQRVAGQDARGRQRPGHRARAPWRGRRAAGALPAAEQAFVAEGAAGQRRLVMHNDFVLVGPPSDPAGVRGLDSARGAREDRRRAVACSCPAATTRAPTRGRRSCGTKAGITPAGGWYQATGQGMGATLRVASEKAATPCRTGRPTWPSATRSSSRCSARATPAC